MLITYKITEEDKKRYISSNLITNKSKMLNIIFLLCFLILFSITLLALIAKDYFFAFSVFAVSMVLLILVRNAPKFQKKKYISSLEKNSYLNETRTVRIDENHLMVGTSSRTTCYKFLDIKKVESDGYFVVITFRAGDSVAIPGSAFSNYEERIDFLNLIRTKAKII